MANDIQDALASAGQVEELADRLSACADSIHARIMRDIGRYPDGVPDAEQNVARAMLDAEQELRQRADRLYLDAAGCIVPALGQPQQRVIQLTNDAAVKIQTIARIGDGITLVARLLGVAAAALTGQGIAVVTALDALRTQLAGMAAHDAVAAASATAATAPPAAPPSTPG